jgi:hypothetical protein
MCKAHGLEILVVLATLLMALAAFSSQLFAQITIVLYVLLMLSYFGFSAATASGKFNEKPMMMMAKALMAFGFAGVVVLTTIPGSGQFAKQGFSMMTTMMFLIWAILALFVYAYVNALNPE